MLDVILKSQYKSTANLAYRRDWFCIVNDIISLHFLD